MYSVLQQYYRVTRGRISTRVKWYSSSIGIQWVQESRGLQGFWSSRGHYRYIGVVH
jgi:hypothetical protein